MQLGERFRPSGCIRADDEIVADVRHLSPTCSVLRDANSLRAYWPGCGRRTSTMRSSFSFLSTTCLDRDIAVEIVVQQAVKDRVETVAFRPGHVEPDLSGAIYRPNDRLRVGPCYQSRLEESTLLVLGRYRVLMSVSVFFSKNWFGFQFRFFQNIVISVRFSGIKC